jgi:anti-anti-sigma regulatory factor
MAQGAKITVARFSSGVTIRVEGRGTISESPVVHAFAERVLRDPGQQVIIDLSACAYMDSNFLGGLVSLFKRDRNSGGSRFAIFVPEAERRSMFGASRLDTIFPFVDFLPPAIEATFELEAQGTVSREELAAYVIECHQRLAEIGGPEAQEFARVADAIAGEVERGR